MEMTRLQKEKVEYIRNLIIENVFSHKKNYEFKEFTLRPNEYFVSLVAEVGMKGDEGTLAQVLCRDRVHLFIGKRGGIKYPVDKNGRYYNKRFTDSIWEVIIDQQIPVL